MSEPASSPQPISRRTFLRQGAVTAALPLVACAAASSAAGTGLRRPLRVGLVGCGGRGTGAAYQALMAEDGTVVLAAVGDLFPDRVEACLANLDQALAPRAADEAAGTPALPDRRGRVQVDASKRFFGFDAYEKVIGSCDVVLLATPPAFRPEHLSAAVRAGKHVFCEKPVAVDAPGVRSVLETGELARERRLSIVSGFCWRYNVRHRAFFDEILERGALGELRAFYSTYNAGPPEVTPRREDWSEMEWQVRNWKSCLWLSGDHVNEQAVHSLDKMAWAFGDVPPLRVLAVGGRQTRGGPENGNIFDHFSATFDYEGGAKGFHMSRQMDGCAFENDDWVYGARGRGKIENWTPLHVIEGERSWTYEGPGNDMYQAEHDALFASIRRADPIDDGTWMAHSTLLAIMTRMSAYSGQPVTWEQALESEERLVPEALSMASAPELRPVAVPGRTS